MPIDSTNYGREMKNLRAEIADLRTEVAFMYSALQNMQEQFGFALAEIVNSVKNLSGEIQNSVRGELENSAEKNFSLLREEMTVLEKNFNRKITENISATDSVNENFSRIEKNFNSLQQNLLKKVSGVGENVSVVQKNISKFSSEVDEILSDNQKTLLKKIDSANNKPQDFYKTLNAIEELLRLIAANQLLNEVQQNLPQKKYLPNVSSQKQIQNSASTKNNSSEQKNSAQSKNPMKTAWLEGVFEHGQKCIALGGIDNRKIAFKNFLEAAERGHIGAMKWLADCYRYGWGTVKDPNKNKYWRDKWEHSS